MKQLKKILILASFYGTLSPGLCYIRFGRHLCILSPSVMITLRRNLGLTYLQGLWSVCKANRFVGLCMEGLKRLPGFYCFWCPPSGRFTIYIFPYCHCYWERTWQGKPDFYSCDHYRNRREIFPWKLFRRRMTRCPRFPRTVPTFRRLYPDKKCPQLCPQLVTPLRCNSFIA